MASYYDAITPEQAALIARAPLFFIASADPELGPGPHAIGPVNLSPKGGVPLHIISPTRVAYLDYKGSGNETACHIGAGSPVTLMVCCFESEDAAESWTPGRVLQDQLPRASEAAPAATRSCTSAAYSYSRA